MKKKLPHPNWWIQRSTTNCGYEIKIVMKESHSKYVPEHIKESCCLVGEQAERVALHE